MNRHIWVALTAAVASIAGIQNANADCGCQPGCNPCQPCQPTPYMQSPVPAAPQYSNPMAPQDPMDQAPMSPMDPMLDSSANADLPSNFPSPANSFASSSFIAASGEGIGFRDSTIGDFFGSTTRITGGSFYLLHGSDELGGFNVPIGASDRRFKLSENISPIPVDRWFVNYNHFHNAIFDAGGNQLNVDRVSMGLEKTFLNGAASFEFRAPLVGGNDAFQDQSVEGEQSGIEFGNITLTLKGILWECGDTYVTAGLGLNLPTAASGEVLAANGDRLFVDNEAVHLLPFAAVYKRFTPNTFGVVMVQFDFDANGNGFAVESGSGQLLSSENYLEQNLVYIDGTFGHWFYESCGCSMIRRIAAIGELHYTANVNDADVASLATSAGDTVVTNPGQNISVLNGTAGLRFQLWDNYMLTTSAVFPLLEAEESKLFDAEFAMLLTRRF